MYSEQKGVVESLSNSSDNVFLMVDWEILQSEYTYFITNSKALSEKKTLKILHMIQYKESEKDPFNPCLVWVESMM